LVQAKGEDEDKKRTRSASKMAAQREDWRHN
jgi:hypothetical protein